MQRLLSAFLVLFGLAVGVLLSEAGFRYILVDRHPERFVTETGNPPVWFMAQSRWQFNEAYGYDYGSHMVYGGSARDGRVKSCWTWPANARGNMGLIDGDYDSADLKVLVFGDSFTAQIDTGPDPRGITWPDYLKRRLATETGRTVHVVNFGRDGTGILQMLDLAVDKVAEWKPDLAIVAFTTDDLTRGRFWRTVTEYDGQERVVTTTVPEEHPPYEFSADTAILNFDATREWCEEMVRTGKRDDPVLREMEAVVLEQRARANFRLSPWDPTYSLLYDQIVHADPFHSIWNRRAVNAVQNPRHPMRSFAEDARLVDNLARIKATGVPLVVVHLALHDELAAGKEYILRDQEQSLLTSLPDVIGGPVHETKDNAPEPEEGLAAIRRSPGDQHPSVIGMQFYAEAVLSALRKEGFLD